MFDAIIVVLTIAFVLVCMLLTLVVLMQRPRSEGLGTAFGESFTGNIFGVQTADVLVKFTIYLGVAFFVFTFGLALMHEYKPKDETLSMLEEASVETKEEVKPEEATEQEVMEPKAPLAPVTPVTEGGTAPGPNN